MDPPPQYSDSLEWIAAYLTAHSLSIPSRRYSFVLWLAVVLVFLAFGILHWTGSRGGSFGAIWSKWALLRRTWREKHTALAQRTDRPHRQPISLPSNAQLFSLTVLALASLALASFGPDYLAPSIKVWQVLVPPSPPPQSYDASPFVLDIPQYTISKSFWSSSARVGQIAFALLPLCVLFALKAPPFAIFAVPFMIQLYFEKLAWLHKWAGRFIWFLAAIHVALWSIQLAKDANPFTGRVAYVYAWSYTPFIYGWIAFTLLTLIVILSLYPIRRRFYEQFYILHLLLVPSMLVMAGLHHPDLAWWCWAALALWIGERTWRATWWIYANGVMGGVASGLSPPVSNLKHYSRDTWEMEQVHHPRMGSTLPPLPVDGRSPSPLHDYYLHDDESHIFADHDISMPKALPPAPLPRAAERNLSRASTRFPSPYIPPPGYVHAELLSGRTVRLRLITPGFLPWSPGQHFLLNIPSVSRLTSHPFTCASVCDEEAPTDAGRIMLFLVRAKGGWTRDLWNLVTRLTVGSRGDPSTFTSNALPNNGVLLRAYVDGPFGSAKRVRWGNYSTAVIITGGSGISFGLSLLQYMCMCLAGRDGRYLGGRPGGWGWKGAELKRVRFIWLAREYSHLQWCACTIRYCMSIVPSSALQVDLFVTNFKPVLLSHISPRAPSRARFDREPVAELEPHPNFAREDPGYLRSRSTDSIESHESHESDVDLSYYLGEFSEDELPAADDIHVAHEENILDLTNFDGDVDMASPRDTYLSHMLKTEGELRRRQSRKWPAVGGMKQDAPSARHIVSGGDSLVARRFQDPLQTSPDWYTTPPSRSLCVPQPPHILTRSTDRLLPVSSLSVRGYSPSAETDAYSPLSYQSDSPLISRSQSDLSSPSSDLLPTVSLVTPNGGLRPPVYPAKAYHDIRPEYGKPHAIQIPYSTTQLRPYGPSNARLPFEMVEQEVADINVVSEHARTGKPKLDKAIADEVQASKGAVVVACCGPTSLNAMVRKIVAAHIDPGRIRRGDMRGSITLVSEEFEY